MSCIIIACSLSEPLLHCLFNSLLSLPAQRTQVSKMTVDYRDGVSILQLIIYLPYLFASIYVCYRHGFMKNSGWIYLVIFCTIRIVGSCAQLATINSTSTTPYTIAAITSAIGISPLLLSSLGLISRA